MDLFTMAHAKRDFERGYLTGWRIELSPMADGWNVVLRGRATFGALVDARSHQPRVFKSMDAAVSSLVAIGFHVVALTSA